MANMLFGRYALLEDTLARSNVGEIYKAKDIRLQRDVCIKIIDNKKIEVKKTQSEVYLMIDLASKTIHIPTIYDYFVDSNKSYIIMEWIDGYSLRDKINDMSERQFIKVITDVLETLSIMGKERNNLNHKDIKPENIMIDVKKSLTYVIDFNSAIATPNHIDGTNNYKPPEMYQASITTNRSKVDIFSIGVILYEYYTKHIPVYNVDYIKNSTRTGTVWDTFKEPKGYNNEINDEMNNLIIKCMSYHPNDRYSNLYKLKRDINQIFKRRR